LRGFYLTEFSGEIIPREAVECKELQGFKPPQIAESMNYRNKCNMTYGANKSDCNSSDSKESRQPTDAARSNNTGTIRYGHRASRSGSSNGSVNSSAAG